MENLSLFYDHLVFFTPIGNILWPFGIFLVIWFIFPRFGILYQEKSGNSVQETCHNPTYLRRPKLKKCFASNPLSFCPEFM
jgi:hypothetical protein